MRTMKMTRLLFAGVISTFLLLVAGTGGSALASPPDIQVINVDETFPAGSLSNFCGFPVLRHDQVRVRIITHYDQSGNPIREMDLDHGTVSFTANGHTVSGTLHGFDSVTFNPDGTSVFFSAGPLLVVLPGVGPVWGANGTFRITYDQDGNLISFEHNGPFFRDPAICAALAP